METKIAAMNADTTKIDIVEATMESLEQTRKKFRKIETELLETSADKDDHKLLVEFLEAFEDRYIQTKGMLYAFYRIIVNRDKVTLKPENVETDKDLRQDDNGKSTIIGNTLTKNRHS